MVFLRKRAADCCRAGGLQCHRLRLIYPPPLSSCYAWSLNFPFLLFFPCFFSQIPPFTLPDSPHHHQPPSSSQLSFICAAVPFFQNLIRAEYMPQGSFKLSEQILGRILKYYVSLTSQHMMYIAHIHTCEHFRIHLYSLPHLVHGGPETISVNYIIEVITAPHLSLTNI